LRGAPRTDPGVRNYRTGLLPWVVTRSDKNAPAVSAPTPHAGTLGTVSDPWCLETNCPWPAPFPRPAPRTYRAGDMVKPRCDAVVRRLPRYYGAVRLPTLAHRRLAPVGFTARTAAPSPPRPNVGPPSSCAESLRTCMVSSTARGPVASRVSDATGIAFGIGERPRRPGLRKISRLNGQPARTPTNACNVSLRTHRHGSGPVRGATALPYGSLIHDSPPATGASPPNLRCFNVLSPLIRPSPLYTKPRHARQRRPIKSSRKVQNGASESAHRCARKPLTPGPPTHGHAESKSPSAR